MPAIDRSRPHGALSKTVGLLALAASLLAAHPAQAQQQLSFFKNYFVTGDYVVRGVSLWRKGIDGKAVAHIPPLGVSPTSTDGVPARADIVAAFLYVQTAEKIRGSGVDYLKVHLKFNGYDFGPFANASGVPGSGTLAKPLNWEAATPPCWSVAYPGGRRLVTYRADVLRFLPIDTATGKQALTVPHRVEVPDWGFKFKDDDEGTTETQTENGPRAVGASLVVVYRDRTQPFRGVVLYDGGVTKKAFATMDQKLEGFYQSLNAGTTVKLTHIVGDGRPFLSERVRTNGEKDGLAGPSSSVTNPFRSADGPKWDDWTSSVALPPNADSVKVRVEPHTLLSDCTSWSAMVLSTQVQDTDDDGLLDEWETNGGLVDPNGQLLPDLAAMGADPSVKDLFVEVGYMKTDQSLSYGSVVKPPHMHLPSAEALKRVAQAFDKKAIKVHFDVGNNHQTGEPYIIPASLARGGEAIDERTTVCSPRPEDPSVCQFSAYPGTVGWKSGFRVLRDQVLAGAPPNVDGTDPCDAPNSSCVRRFDRNRKDLFRYALFAHAIGMPKDPCFLKNANGEVATDTNGNPISDLSCNTPDFHVPRTNSGIADFPGGDLLVTLGAFDDNNGLPIGTDYMQAGTLMHELGHNFELTHAGPPAFPVREPNCKPNYLSVMNYLFQLRGLLDAAGAPQLDYSDAVIGGINETGLLDAPFPPVPYRTGWYAPLHKSYLNGFAPAATKHCDGSDLLTAADGTLLEPAMVRVDSLGLAGDGIDWNADGLNNLGGVLIDGLQDVNFNGLTAALNDGVNDWENIRLNELGGRRSVGGFFKHAGRYFMGPLSLDIGRGDIGRGDIGRGDIGRGDIGRGDIGRGDIGRGDIGRGDIGRGDIGRGDIGRGDIGRGDIGRGDFGGGDMDVGAANEIFNGELDFATFIAATGNAPTPANALRACLTDGEGQCVSEGGNAPVRLNWLPPNVGQALSYQIYRFVVNSDSPFPPTTLPGEPIGTVFGIDGPVLTTYLDRSAANGASYAYFIVARFADGGRSGISNFATIATPAVGLQPPVLLNPIGSGDAIAQNNRATGCSLLPGPDASRGRGYMIAFDWQDVESASAYRLVARRVGAERALVDQVVQSSAYTHISCNSFAPDSSLTGWEWTVQTQDAQGRLSEPSAPVSFQFQSCVLDDGETLCHVPEPPSASGGLTDATGDAGGEGNPDLVSGSVVVQEEFVSLQVRFAPGTFNRDTTAVQFSLDTDQNARTGHLGTDSGCGADNGVLGVEYIVDFGSIGYGTQANIRPFVGPDCNGFGGAVQSAPGSVTYLANGFDVVFPRSFLGGDDGFMNFKVVSYSYIGPGFTGVVDRMTDAGAAPGVVIGR
jgi:hypothetical protein